LHERLEEGVLVLEDVRGGEFLADAENVVFGNAGGKVLAPCSP